MSGGSFDYLCHSWSWEDLAPKSSALAQMRDRLKEVPNGDLARLRTDEIIKKLEDVNLMLPALRDVWRAVEWLDSNDWGEDQLQEVLEEFNNRGGLKKK